MLAARLIRADVHLCEAQWHGQAHFPEFNASLLDIVDDY